MTTEEQQWREQSLRALQTLDLVWARNQAEPAAIARGWLPPDDHTLLASLHKARTVHPGITDEQKAESLAWLKANGMGGYGASWGIDA